MLYILQFRLFPWNFLQNVLSLMFFFGKLRTTVKSRLKTLQSITLCYRK